MTARAILDCGPGPTVSDPTIAVWAAATAYGVALTVHRSAYSTVSVPEDRAPTDRVWLGLSRREAEALGLPAQ